MFGRLADERGSLLIEVLVSAVVVVLVAVGVLTTLDRSTTLTRQQNNSTDATEIVQDAQESLRSLRRKDISNLRATTYRKRDGTDCTPTALPALTPCYYAIASKADWVSDSTGDADCTSGTGGPSYLLLNSTISWVNMGGRKPVSVSSIVANKVGTSRSDLGTLNAQVIDRNGKGIPGMGVSLSGTKNISSTTSNSGCVIWADLPVGNGYNVNVGEAGYVTPTGGTTIAQPVGVVGSTTASATVQYDKAGSIRAKFITDRPSNTQQTAQTNMSTSPPSMAVDIAQAGGVTRTQTMTSDTGEITGLFPFTQAYSVHADTCSLATPTGTDAVSAVVTPTTRTDATSMNGSNPYPGVRLPAKNIRVMNGSAAVPNAVIKVTTRCGTVIKRTAQSNGWIDDPGFPFMPSDTTNKLSGLTICASSPTSQTGTHRKLILPNTSTPALISNTTFAGTVQTMDLAATGSTSGAAGTTAGDC